MVELPKLDIDLKQYQLREIPDIDKLWKEKQARIKEKEFDVQEEVQKKQLDNFAIDEEKEFEQFHNEHDMECQQSSPNPFKSRYDNLSKGNFEIIPSPEPLQSNEIPKKAQNQFTVPNENVNENLVDTVPNDNLTEGTFDMVPNLHLNEDIFGAIPNHDLNQNIFNSVLNDVISQDMFDAFPNNMNQNLYDTIPEDEHVGNNQHNNTSVMDNSFRNLFTFKEEDMEMNYDEFNLQDSNNLALNQSFNELANLGQAYGLNASENNTNILENNQNHNQNHQEHWKHIEGLNQSNTFSDMDNFLNKDFDFEHDSIQLKLAKNVFKEM
ncbi:hypothetical protein K502DRAFT_4920 [Neoconidiobolus thromboides FSU 785]|nr:hypothetical protein K502DRAFT_4920 [Neoconidiobolus thromboides FSU 785]